MITQTATTGTWGPLLIGVYGAALMAAGLLRADPADGCRPRPAPRSRCGYSAA